METRANKNTGSQKAQLPNCRHGLISLWAIPPAPILEALTHIPTGRLCGMADASYAGSWGFISDKADTASACATCVYSRQGHRSWTGKYKHSLINHETWMNLETSLERTQDPRGHKPGEQALSQTADMTSRSKDWWTLSIFQIRSPAFCS